ncbi:hypothetical protein [uncultured Oscillibacter sp.]|uniref:hypothetical protein n=2 Tax=uncultured Oscillibacter sp. TaxID=876091 RepID=UPI0025EC413E|nr:hypothetical protein [uncultured Oscillibacter sp.]
MNKMSEHQRSGPCGGKDCDMAQIYQHLRSKDPTELADELAALTEDAANGNPDLALIDAYLEILDEKAPLPFAADPQEALSAFHEKHGLLEKETSTPRRRRPRSPHFPIRAVASFAAVLFCSSILAQAYGINIWGTIARVTSETFRMEKAEVPYAEVSVYPIAQGESAEYGSLSEAVEAFGITAPLAPTWVPERFGTPEAYAIYETSGICIYMDCVTEEDFLTMRFIESSRATQQIVEKDSSPDSSYFCNEINHHIIIDQSLAKIIWCNGIFECRISGSITEEEVRKIIDSIYEERD